MARTRRKSKEEREIVLGEDGQHALLRPAHQPDRGADLRCAGQARGAGLAGWNGGHGGRLLRPQVTGRKSPPAPLMVRPL